MRYVLRIENGFGLLHDSERHDYQRIPLFETRLLETAAQHNFRHAKSLLEATEGTDVAQMTVESVRRRGYLSDSDEFDGRVVHLPHMAGTYRAPLACHIGLTTACNFSCSHCYSSSGKKSPNELTRVEIENILDELAAIGCMQLVFGGGEPFLRKDLPQLIGRANALGMDSYVHTNASLASHDVLQQLAGWPPTGLTISLDGASAKVNDSVRGPGTFEQTVTAMRMIRENYPPGFAISMTITGVNHHEAEAMVDLAQAEGATLLLLRPPFPSGNMLEARHLMTDLATFWAAVGKARARGRQIGMTVNSPQDGGAVLPTDFDGFGCIAAHVVLGITPTGDVTPCLNLPDEYFAANIRGQSVLRLWRDGSSFKHLRALEPNPDCEECEHYEVCRGGCRIRAIDAGRGDNGPDTWCYRELGRGVRPFSGEGASTVSKGARPQRPSLRVL